MSFSLSPSVDVVERDLSLSTQTIVDNAGAFVGNFNWGPVEERVLISGGDAQLISKFAAPDNNTYKSFYAVSNFMSYGAPCYVVRTSGAASRNAVPTGEIAVLVKNKNEYETATLTGLSLVAKYPGTKANGLVCESVHGTAFDTWAYADQFEYPPSATEAHGVVIDALGAFSGTPGTVLEKFEFIQGEEGATKPDGSNAYFKDVINEQSAYVYVGDTAIPIWTENGVKTITLAGGVDDHVGAVSDYRTGWDLFASVDDVQVSYLITGACSAADAGYVVDLADARQDCMAFVSPEQTDVVNAIDPMSNVLDFRNTGLNRNTSYGFMDDNWKYQYDKYNNVSRWLPCNPDTAGLWARVATINNPWESAAGYNRGQIKNVTRLAWNSAKANRDQLFKKQINSIVSFQGSGTLLFGDKTLLTRPSVFTGANVRFLFIVLRKSIAETAKYQLFELNTVATRSRFANQVTQFLRNIQTKQGIIQFRVIADERNNTEQVINEGRFVAQIAILPAQSIRNVVLEFSAVNSTAQFNEIEQALAA